MKWEEVQKLNWRHDGDLLVVERRLEALIERGKLSTVRLAELGQIVRDAEDSLIYCRAALLLNEPTPEPEKVIQDRLTSARLEISEIEGGLVALKMAQERIAPAVAEAGTKARLRIAETLLQPYRQSASNLKALLKKAAGENRTLHAIHSKMAEQQLHRDVGENLALTPLGSLVAWNCLTRPDGNDAGEYQYWHNYVGSIMGED